MKDVAAVIAGLVLFVSAAIAQDDAAAPPPGAGYTWSASDLQKLVGPIALYPDPLVAEILPAATFPSQIVMANRYLADGGDPSQVDQQPWDPSVQALAHYPNVLKWMDDNLQWTTQLGEAFQNQQPDVMNAVQGLRTQAQNLGNLPSTPQENVVTDDGNVEIEPANPDDMYIPTYDPNTIYYDPGVYCSFGVGLPLGLWLGYDWDWHNRHLFYWNGGRPGNWWGHDAGWRNNYIAGHHGPIWHAGGFGPGRAQGWDRGFANTPGRRFAPAIPRGSAPRVDRGGGGPGITVIGRSAGTRAFSPEPASRELAPHQAAPRQAAPHEEGAFGGFQSGAEAHAWSSRGESSRAAMAPAGGGHEGGGGGFGGGHAGGGAAEGGGHAGGGGGGGGGHGGGGGGHR